MTFINPSDGRLCFGKHKGKRIDKARVPTDYRLWALAEIDGLTPRERDTLHLAIERRERRAAYTASGPDSHREQRQQPQPPRPACLPSLDVALEVIGAGRRTLARQHHPDVAGPRATERMQAINAAADALERAARALPVRAFSGGPRP